MIHAIEQAIVERGGKFFCYAMLFLFGFLIACGVAWLSWISAYSEELGCAQADTRAKESQDAIKICQQLPGCNISVADLLKTRAQITRAQECAKRE